MPDQREMTTTRSVDVGAGAVSLAGDLTVPPDARGVVLFAHGSGSSRHSPRNRQVADALHERQLATLLIDLLTAEEEERERYTRHLRFDIGLLIERLDAARAWLRQDGVTRDLALGCFGASTGAAAALGLAGLRPGDVGAVVSRGGRPDLTPPNLLAAVRAPTLLIVGERDEAVIEMNRAAQRAMAIDAELVIVPGASHLFEEAGTLERVADLAGAWFERHLAGSAR
jgi:pimeloyl-ACP methyl ester carboxylesterase